MLSQRPIGPMYLVEVDVIHTQSVQTAQEEQET